MFQELPEDIQALAREKFQEWKADPASVGWHRIAECKADVFSADINFRYRAVGILTKGPDKQDRCCWVFIGRHPVYEKWIATQNDRVANTWTRDAAVQRMFSKMDANPVAQPMDPSSSNPSPFRRKNR